MLFPKKVKHRKWQTFRRNPARVTADTRGLTVAFGSYGLKATSHARVKSNQIEAARRVISRTLGKTGRLWVRIFPDRPYTKKAAEVPMGKGKGDPEGFIFEVLPGRVLFEVDGVTADVAKEAFRKATAKLPVKSKCVAREG
jgi:large subunit ribosomal protein L16